MKNARYDWKRGVLPMELITRSRERRRIAIIVVALVLALLIALAYTIVSSRQATAAAVETMSEVYLQELSNQVISHFNTGIDGKFCQLETVGSSLELYDPENLDEVRDFLACMEADDDEYAYLALRGSDGLYYTSWGSDAASDEELAARSELGLSYRDAHGHDVMLYNGTIALVDSFEPVTCGGVTFTAVVAGFGVDTVSGKLNLDLVNGSARSSVIGFDGTCIAGCDAEGLCNGENLFDALESSARLDKGYSMDQVREAVENGETFLLPFWYGGHHEYLYFRPMSNQDWYLCTAMPYGVVDEDVAGLSWVLMQNAVLMATMIIAVIAIFFSIYYQLVKRNTRLLSDEKNRAERASEEARRASLAKSEFLSRMSHEIRTPMNGIMGMTAIALENAHDEEKARACLEKIDVTSEHLMALINDILDMSKIESGKIDIKRETFDFGTFVGSLDDVFGTQALEQGIRYKTEEVGALPSLLVGEGASAEPDRLQSRWQRFQVHSSRRQRHAAHRGASRAAGRGCCARRRDLAALLGDRYGLRHQAGEPRADILVFRAGRRVFMQTRRHGSGPCHHEAVRGDDGRPYIVVERGGEGVDLHGGRAVRASLGRRGRHVRRCVRRAVPNARRRSFVRFLRQARHRRRRQRAQPRDSHRGAGHGGCRGPGGIHGRRGRARVRALAPGLRRPDLHGHPDARDGRLRGDPRHSLARSRRRAFGAHRRDDGQRVRRGRGAQPHERNGWPSEQTP